MSTKHKVQAAATMAPGHSYYRRAGLVLSKDQQEYLVDVDQLAILRSDKRVIVVGGPDLPPQRAAEKPTDERDVRMQQLAESRDVLDARARAAEAEVEQLKAQLLKAKGAKGEGEKTKTEK